MKIRQLAMLCIIPITLGTYSAYAQVDLASESPILNSGMVSTVTDDYVISRDLDVRQFSGGDIVRISGFTIDDHFYYAYHWLEFEEIQSKGNIIINGNFVPIVFTKVIESNPEPVEEITEFDESGNEVETDEPIEELKELEILYDDPTRTRIQKNYLLTLKSVVPGTEVGIPGVTMTVTMRTPDGELVKTSTSEGESRKAENPTIAVTDEQGLYNHSFFLIDRFNWAGTYSVEVTAEKEGYETSSVNFNTIILQAQS